MPEYKHSNEYGSQEEILRDFSERSVAEGTGSGQRRVLLDSGQLLSRRCVKMVTGQKRNELLMGQFLPNPLRL